MDIKVLAGVLAISLLALVGVVFAMPNWHNGDDVNASPRFNSTGNSTGSSGLGFGRGCIGQNRMQHNDTTNWTGSGFNETGGFAHPPAPRFNRGNQTGPQANSAQIEEFRQAIESGDYQAAKDLHETYHLGGPLFDRLTESTFSKYSQIVKLNNELRQELGLNSQSGIGPGFGGFEGGSKNMRNRE